MSTVEDNGAPPGGGRGSPSPDDYEGGACPFQVLRRGTPHPHVV